MGQCVRLNKNERMVIMSDWVSIIGASISIIGVILSLLLFNSSINNGRKILLKRILILIQTELLYFFSPILDNKYKVSKRENIYKSLVNIESLLDEINYYPKIDIPGLKIKKDSLDNNMIKNTILLNEFYKNLEEYLNKRNITNFRLIDVYFNGAFELLQYYNLNIKYNKRFLIGPIQGVKTVLYRKKKFALIDKAKIPLIRKINNEKKLEKYYNECYMNFNYKVSLKEKEKLDKPGDIVITTPKDKQLKTTWYI